MFGKNAKDHAADAAYDALDALCRPYIQKEILNRIVQSDPYVTGFLTARLPGICVLTCQERGLQMSDAKEVMAMVMLKLYGSTAEGAAVIARSNSLRQARDERYILGFERGGKMMNYALHKEDITSDPDFERAMEYCRSIGMPQSNDMSIPLSGLDRLWFGSYMEQYL